MMKKVLFIGLAAVAIGGATYTLSTFNESTYTPRAEEPSDIATRGIAGAFEYYEMTRQNVITGQPVTADEVIKMRGAVHKKAATQSSRAVGLQWEEMGPDNVGGRTRAIAINPNNPDEIWAGGVSGGLWRSDSAANSWFQVTSFGAGVNGNANDDNVNVASIGIAGNGDIVVGTGSLFDGSGGFGGSGFLGGGIFRSTDDGASWSLIAGPAAPFNGNLDYIAVDEIWADPNNPDGMWVGSTEGLEYLDLTNNSFTLVQSGTVQAMSVSSDGQTVLSAISGGMWLSTNGGDGPNATFTNINGNINVVSAVNIQAGRKEVAISPDDGNYMYILQSTATGAMAGVYGSTDRGQNWSSLWPDPVPPSLDIFGGNTQGGYDNVIEVVPGSPDEFWVGGVSLWKGNINGQPLQIALTASFPGCFNCVHADVHEITWDVANQIAYVGCDGGVYKGFVTAGNEVFFPANRGYNVTQFYGIGFGHDNRVLGGTQDNSSPYLTLDNVNSAQEADVLFGGDGFDSEISQLDPNILFATSQFGVVGRSADDGLNFGGFFSDSITMNANAAGNLSDFFTNIRLWETYDDPNSPNTAEFFNIGIDTIFAGDQFEYRGRNTSIPLFAFAAQDIFPGDSVISLPDPVQSLFATGIFSNGSGNQDAWVTRDALAINVPAEWWRVGTGFGNISAFEFSADGNNLFVSNTAGQVFQVTGLAGAYTFASADISRRPVNAAVADTSSWLIELSTGDTIRQSQATLDYANESYTLLDGTPIEYALTVRFLTSGAGPALGLASDPQDPAHLVVTHGGYGGGNKVRESNNVLDATPTFANIWNPGAGLTGMPVYDAIIHRDDPNIIVVGAEWGIYATDDGGATWNMENDGGTFVPVYEVRQQINNFLTPHWFGPSWYENSGVIYIGTHGRGAFMSRTLLSVEDDIDTPTSTFNALMIYPNPSTDVANFTVDLNRNAEVVAAIYDLNGRYVKNVVNSKLTAGQRSLQFNVNELANGTYLLHLQTGAEVKVGRFVVQH